MRGHQISAHGLTKQQHHHRHQQQQRPHSFVGSRAAVYDDASHTRLLLNTHTTSKHPNPASHPVEPMARLLPSPAAGAAAALLLALLAGAAQGANTKPKTKTNFIQAQGPPVRCEPDPELQLRLRHGPEQGRVGHGGRRALLPADAEFRGR